MLIHAFWGGVAWSPCHICTLPSLRMLLLKSRFPMIYIADSCAAFALLELNPSCASPHTYSIFNDEAWSLHRYLHPCFCFLIPPFCPLPSLTSCLLAYICPPPSFAVREHHGEFSHQLYWAFASGVHKSLGFEGFTGCCSDWDEYCVSLQCTASNSTSIFSVHWAEFLTSYIILSLLQQLHKVNPYPLTHRKSSGEIYVWHRFFFF